jgi:hypothetical protein
MFDQTGAKSVKMFAAKCAAILAVGLTTIASIAPAFTQTNGECISAARAAAVRECNREGGKYPNPTYGATFEIMCTAPAWPSMARRNG